MTQQDLKTIHSLLVAENWNVAGNHVLTLLGDSPRVMTKAQSLQVCRGLFQFLLDSDRYLEAATLQWGPDLFNTEPESVQRVFKAWHTKTKILFMGASSMGKTFASGAWLVLDWMRDPLFTTVKLAAVSENHLNDNLFAHVKRLVNNCAIPLAHDIHFLDSDLWFGVRGAGFEFGFSGLAFKQSQETSGQFKGYKVLPVRKKPHPKFGVMSRLRVLGDEGQNWPGGPFKDFNSLTASIGDDDLIKMAVAFNPEDTNRIVVQMAEPDQGWLDEDVEVLYDYESKVGWWVCRLDASKSENVVQRKKVYSGLQTHEGFMAYLKAGGDNSANFMCFARGFPPLKGAINTIIPPSWPQMARGEATFIDNPINLCAIDLAYQGKDSAQMVVARWGKASEWRDHMGVIETFRDRLNVAKEKPRHVLQIDQIFQLSKHDDTGTMAEEVIGRCKMMRITPEWTALDKTGVGLGTYSHLNQVWGQCFGIQWNEGATEGKILAEDNEGADKQCDGVMSEMWWAFRRWLDPRCRAILINPIIPPQPIQTQLTSRRYKTGKRGIKVESKEEYKARNQTSPDEVDSMVMLVHLLRNRGEVLPGLMEESSAVKNTGTGDYEFHSVKDMKSVEEDDYMADDGVEGELSVANVNS